MKQILLTIVDDIVRFFLDYAKTGAKLAGAVVIIYWVSIFVWKVCLQKAELRFDMLGVKSSLLFLLVMYVYIVVGITILSRIGSQFRCAYFELFRIFQDPFFEPAQFLENIYLFIPYAVLLFGFSSKMRNGRRMFIVGLISSITIEITQWITYTGYFDIDDIWMNVLGMMLGYFGCVVIVRRAANHLLICCERK